VPIMMPTPNRKCFLLVLCLLFLVRFPASAQEASLSDIIVTNTRDDLLLYVTVQGAFTEKMTQAILSGVPATFSYFITLERVRSLWADEEIVDLKVSNTIKYNSLKKEFTVTRSWDNGKPQMTQSFEEAQRWMAKIDGLKVVSLNRLEKGSQYQLNAKAELNKLTLPFYLHHVLVFVSLWDFETDWYTIDFIY